MRITHRWRGSLPYPALRGEAGEPLRGREQHEAYQENDRVAAVRLIRLEGFKSRSVAAEQHLEIRIPQLTGGERLNSGVFGRLLLSGALAQDQIGGG